MSFLTPNEEQHNLRLYIEVDDALSFIFPLELVRLISTYASIRPTIYVEDPEMPKEMKELSRCVHQCIYSSDELPWIVLVRTIPYRTIFVFRAFVAKWDPKLVLQIVKDYLDLEVLHVDVTHRSKHIGYMMEATLQHPDAFPFPIHAYIYRPFRDHMFFTWPVSDGPSIRGVSIP